MKNAEAFKQSFSQMQVEADKDIGKFVDEEFNKISINIFSKIKQLADEAIKLQNKNRMDEVLREISAMCERQVDLVSGNYNDQELRIINKPFDENSSGAQARKEADAKNAKDESCFDKTKGFGLADLHRTNGVVLNSMPKMPKETRGKK